MDILGFLNVKPNRIVINHTNFTRCQYLQQRTRASQIEISQLEEGFLLFLMVEVLYQHSIETTYIHGASNLVWRCRSVMVVWWCGGCFPGTQRRTSGTEYLKHHNWLSSYLHLQATGYQHSGGHFYVFWCLMHHLISLLVGYIFVRDITSLLWCWSHDVTNSNGFFFLNILKGYVVKSCYFVESIQRNHTKNF